MMESVPAPVTVGDLRFVPMIDAGRIEWEVTRLGASLTERYADRRPLVVCVLNGAAVFHADLIRRMPIPLEVDYVRVSSYEGGLVSSGAINFTAGAGTLLDGRNVILVEDIVDTGRTALALRRYFRENGAASVEVAALLYKREADLIGAEPEYVAFEIPNRFVVGYGLDYMQQGRNLPAIYVLDDR
jgi:hypoxanthine phosphoribosyltransferase